MRCLGTQLFWTRMAGQRSTRKGEVCSVTATPTPLNKGGSGFAAITLRFLNATAVRKHAEREAASCCGLTPWQETVSGTAAQNGVGIHELE